MADFKPGDEINTHGWGWERIIAVYWASTEAGHQRVSYSVAPISRAGVPNLKKIRSVPARQLEANVNDCVRAA